LDAPQESFLCARTQVSKWRGFPRALRAALAVEPVVRISSAKIQRVPDETLSSPEEFSIIPNSTSSLPSKDALLWERDSVFFRQGAKSAPKAWDKAKAHSYA
jgi:hypothetical protein